MPANDPLAYLAGHDTVNHVAQELMRNRGLPATAENLNAMKQAVLRNPMLAADTTAGQLAYEEYTEGQQTGWDPEAVDQARQFLPDIEALLEQQLAAAPSAQSAGDDPTGAVPPGQTNRGTADPGKGVAAQPPGAPSGVAAPNVAAPGAYYGEIGEPELTGPSSQSLQDTGGAPSDGMGVPVVPGVRPNRASVPAARAGSQPASAPNAAGVPANVGGQRTTVHGGSLNNDPALQGPRSAAATPPQGQLPSPPNALPPPTPRLQGPSGPSSGNGGAAARAQQEQTVIDAFYNPETAGQESFTGKEPIIVPTAGGRVAVIDGDGRMVQQFPTQAEAQAFIDNELPGVQAARAAPPTTEQPQARRPAGKIQEDIEDRIFGAWEERVLGQKQPAPTAEQSIDAQIDKADQTQQVQTPDGRTISVTPQMMNGEMYLIETDPQGNVVPDGTVIRESTGEALPFKQMLSSMVRSVAR